jgi:vacuolar-type H+-ATPase subunit H
MEEVNSNVETIEVEAEQLLESARSRANEILLKAKEEAKKISSSELPMDEVKAECDGIIRRAREEANKRIEESLLETSELKTRADEKVDKIVKRLVSIVTGVTSR